MSEDAPVEAVVDASVDAQEDVVAVAAELRPDEDGAREDGAADGDAKDDETTIDDEVDADADAEEEAKGDDEEEEEDEEELPQRLFHMRWDLDKTYLMTEFDSLKDLYKTFMQRAEDKVGIAGARELLQQLMRPQDEVRRRVTFISGSPKQMRKTLERKLNLDGIKPDVFILKPNLSNLLRGRFRAVRGQVGYKLKALLHSHMLAVEVDEYLFGDDSEQDAFIYSLYADILGGRVDATALLAILTACRIYRSDITELMALHSRLYNSGDVVRRIFIHLEARSPLGRFKPYGARVVAIYNYFQAALLLFEASILSASGLLAVVDAMEKMGYTPTRLANSLQDLLRRGVLKVSTVRRVSESLATHQLHGHATRFTRRFEAVVAELHNEKPRTPPPTVEEVNYLGLYHAARFRRQRYSLLNTGIRILD